MPPVHLLQDSIKRPGKGSQRPRHTSLCQTPDGVEFGAVLRPRNRSRTGLVRHNARVEVDGTRHGAFLASLKVSSNPRPAYRGPRCIVMVTSPNRTIHWHEVRANHWEASHQPLAQPGSDSDSDSCLTPGNCAHDGVFVPSLPGQPALVQTIDQFHSRCSAKSRKGRSGLAGLNAPFPYRVGSAGHPVFSFPSLLFSCALEPSAGLASVILYKIRVEFVRLVPLFTNETFACDEVVHLFLPPVR